MILTKTIELKINRKNLKNFPNNKIGDVINLDIENAIKFLPKRSTIMLDCKCENCQKIFKKNYRSIYKDNYKIICSNCKSKQTNLEKYGCEHVLQSKIIKDKSKETLLKKYGVDNISKYNEAKEKIKQTNLKKYGYEYATKNEDIKNKIKNTNLKKYGVTHTLSSEVIKNKIKQTNLEKYGCENVFSSKEIQNKIKQTNLKKYGVICTLNNKKIKNKSKQTNLEKYGCEYAVQSKEVRDKIKQTNLEKYGSESVLNNQQIRQKINIKRYENGTINSSQQQEKISYLINGDLNYPLGDYFLDIALLDKKICIEYDGSGHFFWNYNNDIINLDRENFIFSNNWKMIQIKSRKDDLLNDILLIDLLNKSIEKLTNSENIYKIIIDIDKMIVIINDHSFKIKLKIYKELIMNNNEFLTSKEVKELFRITNPTLCNWRKNNILPYIKLSDKKFLYRKTDIEQLIKNGEF